MAEEKKNISFAYIGNALRSAASDGVTAFADELFDTERQEYQQDINSMVAKETENPEFIYFFTDADDRLLWWINADGSVDWAHGVPQPVQVELIRLENLIKENSEGDENLKERVSANEEAIVAINEALDRKVDGIYVDSPEFLRYYCDADDRLLWWINADGSVDWGSGVPQPIQVELQGLEQLIKNNNDSVTEQIEAINNHLNEALAYKESPEYIKMLQDADDRIINAVTPDGTNYLPKANVEELALEGEIVDNDAVKSQVYTESPEFISYTTDIDDRVLEGLKSDGTKYVNNIETNDIETKTILVDEVTLSGDIIDNDAVKSSHYEDNPEFINIEEDADGRILGYTKPDGSHYIHNVESETIPTEFSNIDDTEGRIELKTDAEDRIMSHRDSTGKLHEEAGIETPLIDIGTANINSLNLSQSALNEFEQALRANGFRGGQGDWSEATSLQIPEPRCAMMNITSADGTPYSWPTSKFVNNKVWVEFYDMQGNYFKKRAIHNAQGNSSMKYMKKNATIDFCNDEWIGDDAFKIKFGNWVFQDSFHAKAYYTDFFKGGSVIAYKFAEEVERSRGVFEDKPWKKALIDFNNITSDQLSEHFINDMTLQFDNEALCHPDAFPCIIYIDGNFYGIYAFGLKKHRDNYRMIKDVAEHIHLDGTLSVDNLWNGNINWSQFEIRNPKNLYYKEAQHGTFEYDADLAQAEIAGDDEVNAWIEAGQLPDGTEVTSKIKKRLQITAKVKNYILSLSQTVPLINTASTIDEKKNIFETHFDVNNLVDYEIVQLVTGDNDSHAKNWQWITYDGVKWYATEYDKDEAFGGNSIGTQTNSVPKNGYWMGGSEQNPLGKCIELYESEIVSRWKYLYENKVIDADHIISLFKNWLSRIGTKYFEKEYEKWVEAPCNRDDGVNYEYWQRTNDVTNNTSRVDYDNEKTYNEGDVCYYGFDYSFKFIAKKTSTGNIPLLKEYENFPKTLGYRDNFWRLCKYIKERIIVENNFINSKN